MGQVFSRSSPVFINSTSSPPLLETITGLVLLALGLVVVGVLITTYVTKRVRTKNRNAMESWLSEPSCGKLRILSRPKAYETYSKMHYGRAQIQNYLQN